jgi:hypothetical protein
MNRLTAGVGVLALAACGGGGGEEAVDTQTSALVSRSHRLLHDNLPGGCDTREYTGDGDWYPGTCKTECVSAATGISSSFAAVGSGCPSSVAHPFIALDPGPGPSNVEFTHKLACNNGLAPQVTVSNGYTLKFAQSNDQRFPTVGYDWAPGLVKGECDSSHAITAVASDKGSHSYSCFFGLFSSEQEAYGLVGARCSALSSPPGTYPQAANCQALDFRSADARELNSSGDWDPGFLKGECGDGRYIKGIAHGTMGSGSARTVRILCCSPTYPIIPG